MSKVTQVSATVDKGWSSEFEVIQRDHTPSWKVYVSNGYAAFKAMLHKEAGWVSISLSESYTSDSGKDVVKETMLTLSPESVRELWLFLGQRMSAQGGK